MTRKGILTGGTWCVDRNRLLDHWPPENGIAEIFETEISGGGSGYNLAVDVKRLDPDFPVATVGLVGDDADGHLLLAEADAHKIDRAQLVMTRAAPTHFTEAYSSLQTGRRTHITCRGTSNLLTPEHFDFSSVSQRILHLGLPGLHRLMDGPWADEINGWVAVLRKARAVGLQTNLELASITPERLAELVRPCLPHLDLLVVNDSEIAAVAGSEIFKEGRADTAACIAAMKSVLERGALELVVVHFPMGAIALARDGTVATQPSVNVPASAIVGPNGAGDAFAAGFLYSFHQGWSLADALSLAHATAAASLRKMSTTGAVENWSKCLELANRWGWREQLPR